MTKQRGAVEQTTAPSPDGDPTRALVHAPAPPAGSVDVAMLPSSRVMTHSETVGQLIP